MDWMCEGEERLYVADIGLALLGLVIAGSVGAIAGFAVFYKKNKQYKKNYESCPAQ